MFFERGSYDPVTVAEGRARLAQFHGDTSISLNHSAARRRIWARAYVLVPFKVCDPDAPVSHKPARPPGSIGTPLKDHISGLWYFIPMT